MRSATRPLGRSEGMERIRNTLGSCLGTAYVEYFVVGAAVAVATMWLVGNLAGIQESVYEPQFQSQMDAIKGSVVPP